MPAPITALYAGLLALLLIALASRIPLLRRKHHVGIGSGGNAELSLAIRVHGNAIEYIPAGLILLLIAELNGMPAWFLHSAGGAFFLARIMHAFGLSGSPGYSKGRFFGTALSWLVIAVLALSLIAVPLMPLV